MLYFAFTITFNLETKLILTMKKLILPLSIAVLVLTSSCKQDKKEVVNETIEVEKTIEEIAPKEIMIALNSKSGSTVSGKVIFTEDAKKNVNMLAKIQGLTPGIHAIHIHQTADCTSADGKSSGGHWNPTAQPHGKWGAENGAYHKGDIGNFEANAEGEATVRFSTNEWCIGCDDDTKNILGKAVIVHQGQDDLTSQPSGAAGKRVSCAGIIK